MHSLSSAPRGFGRTRQSARTHGFALFPALTFALLFFGSVLPGFGQTFLSSLTGMTGPTFVAIDHNRTINGTTATWLYVSEHGNTDNTGGGHIYRFNLSSGATTPTVVASPGTADGQFTSPDAILIDAATGDLIISDRALDRVQRITNTGTPVWKFGSGTVGAPDEMHGPCGMAMDGSGNLYIAEHGETLPTNSPGSGGSFISKYAISGSTATRAWRVGGEGLGNGQFNNTGPYGIVVSGSSVLVSDAFNSRVQTFDLNGTYQSQFPLTGALPLGMSLDSTGSLWIAEATNTGNGSGSIQEAQKFTTSGTFGNVTLSGGLNLPFDVAVDTTTNKAYVSDYNNNRIAIFDVSASPTGAPTINSPASASGTVGQPFSYTITATNSPTSFAVDSGTPLPAGLTLSGNTISGTPATTGSTNVNLTASNSSGTSAVFHLDISIAPASSSSGPVATSFTYVAHTLTFALAFNEAVTGVTTNSFVFYASPNVVGGSLASVDQVDPSHYTLNITFSSGAPASMSITIKSSGSGITSVATGQAYSGAGVYKAVVPITPHLDVGAQYAPVVSAFVPDAVTGNTVNFIVTFNKESWNVQPSNLAINTTGSATGTLGYIVPADDSATKFLIPVTFSGSGTISLTLSNATQQTISDGNYNMYVGPDTSAVFAIPTGGGGGGSVPVVSNATVTGSVGTAIAPVQVAATNSPASFDAPGLTAYGLTISASGSISGTPTAAATNATVSVTATNPSGTSAPATITLNIAPATTGNVPVVSNAAVTGNVGTAITPVQVQATNSPIGFSAPGLGAYGLTIDSAGWIAGTPNAMAAGATVNVTANNAAGTSAPATITLNLGAATTGGGSPASPVIQSIVLGPNPTLTHASFVVTFNGAVTGVDATDFAFNKTGTTQGVSNVTVTPGADAATYDVNFDYDGDPATNAGLNGSLQMGIKTSGTGIVDGSSHAFVGLGVTASDAVEVNALPPGADLTLPTVSSFAGTVSGSTATFTLTFSKAVTGVDSSDFVVTTTGTATGTVGTIAGSGTTYTVPVLVGGNGSVAVTVVGGVTANIRDAATNWFAGGGTSTSNTVVVGTTTSNVPVVSNATVSGTVGTPIAAVQVAATNSPTSFDAPGLASYGLAISASGSITGTPTATAVGATINVTATNASGTSAPATITLNIAAGPTGSAPVVSNATVSGTVDTPITSVQVQATNSPTNFSAPGLTSYGLSISSTGLITGTPTTTATNTPVSVTATNGFGTSAPATITLNINAGTSGGSAPVVSSTTVNGTVGIPMSFTVSATNNPTLYSMTGAPAGISINITNGLISGTPTVSGTFTATVTASNSAGAGHGTVTFNIAAETTPPPTLKGQTVIFNTPTSAILINTPISLGATSDSGGPITYTIVSGNAVLDGSTLTIKGSGPVVIRATQAGDSTWASASTTATFTAGKIGQAITASPLVRAVNASQTITLDATASSGLSVTYALVSGPAALSGNVLTFTGASGTVVIRASQGGNDTYDPASDVTLTFNVNSLGQQLFFGTLGSDSFAAGINADNSKGVLLLRVSSTGTALIVRFDIAADGTFSATGQAVQAQSASAQAGDEADANVTATTYAVSGSLNNGVLSGTVTGLGAFSATVQPATGATAGYAGLYTARVPGSAAGETYLAVGPAGQAYALVVTPSTVAAGTGTVSASGAVSVTLSSGGTVTGTIDPAQATISGSLKLGNSTATFAGLSGNVTPTDRLINISSRLRVAGTDVSHSSIAGFVVNGTAPKQILIRAVGPSLARLKITDGLADPTLKLYDNAGTVIATNAGWNDDPTISAAAGTVGAFGFTAGSRDAAILITLQPGAYTAQVESNNNGLVLIEAYDVAANAAVPTKQLVNISTRGYVGTGEDVLIGGFVVTGNEPKRVLIRGAGPALSLLKVTGTLTDPVLKVYDVKGNVIAQNDNWGTPTPIDATQVAATSADISAAETATGAFPFPAGSADAAVIVTLNPGNYSAIVSGANDTTGAAMVEVYEIPTP